MAICKNCGTNNEEGVAYCAGCGAAMEVGYQSPVSYQQPVQQPAYQQPTYQQPAYQQPVYQQPVAPVVPGKGMSITAMILGIISLVFCCAWWISIPCAIVGLILGCIGNSKAKEVGMKSGMAVAGIACSAIAIGLALLLLLFVGGAAILSEI